MYLKMYVTNCDTILSLANTATSDKFINCLACRDQVETTVQHPPGVSDCERCKPSGTPVMHESMHQVSSIK